MLLRRVFGLGCLVSIVAALATTNSTQGLYDLVQRRLPSHYNDFVFSLQPEPSLNNSEHANDRYEISTASNGSIAINGNSLSALSSGLHRYLTDVAHVDIYWFIGSRLDVTSYLPKPKDKITGSSIVPWRYFFNTVTFSYTAAFWTWEDWELELDWLALHGVNLALAWNGVEKVMVDIFRDVGLSDSEINSFLSGPAFQSWARFGNIQGSWNGSLPSSWIDGQFELQKKILARMLELGMTPILPAFTGFVPRALAQIYPNATIVNGSRWNNFPLEYTNVTFLEPSDPLFGKMQASFISKQTQYYGNVTQFYTLDQFNENDPASGSAAYLKKTSHDTWLSLKAANPSAIWVMQGWLFYSNDDFWTDARIEAYLGGVEVDSDMLILDLFSESQPQWQRTNSYYGKPWIWCELHDYGGNQGLYGQVENVTINPIQAMHNSSSLVGFGITPEGQEGNEIMYTLLLDQAWSGSPIDTKTYFRNWVRNRYAGNNSIPESVYTAWDLLRISAYNNTNLTSNAVPKAIYELAPNITGLVNRTSHHPTTINYNPATLVSAMNLFYSAPGNDTSLWNNPSYQHDLVDITRQVYANSFITLYQNFLTTWRSNNTSSLATQASTISNYLGTLDTLLSTLPQFRLSTWIESARAWAPANDTQTADFYEYNARNQITWWGPDGEISDYASKSWGGLVAEYYKPRWESFLGYLVETGAGSYNASVAKARVQGVEAAFQVQKSGGQVEGGNKDLKAVVEGQVLPALREAGVAI